MNHPSAIASRDRPTALVVDDSAVARRALAALLLRLGFRVETASSAEAGLEILDDHLPSVVFMDHLLPELDGLSAVRRIRSRRVSQRLPVVMYTSLETRQFALAARAAGADDVLFKSGGGASLEVILARLGLAPDVAPLEEQLPTNLPAALAAALRRHKEEMREELLAEFAILERYEGSMREELCSRVDSLTRQTVRAVEEQFHERRIANALADQARRRTNWAVAACLTVLFGASASVNVAMWREVKALGQAGPASVSAPVGMQAEVRDSLQTARYEPGTGRGEAPMLTASLVAADWARKPVDQ